MLRAVSFTKGCYPGQELVERMDARQSSSPFEIIRMAGDLDVGEEVIVDDVAVGLDLIRWRRNAGSSPSSPRFLTPRLPGLLFGLGVAGVDFLPVTYVYAFDHKHRKPPMTYKDLLGGKGRTSRK